MKFHNGNEMTAADVVASLQRWGKVATVGRVLWPNVETVEAKAPSTVVLYLKQPSASLVYGLAEPSAVILTRDVAEAAGPNQLKELVGTGPYRFVEHKPDRHIELARFKDYEFMSRSRSSPSSNWRSWASSSTFRSWTGRR